MNFFKRLDLPFAAALLLCGQAQAVSLPKDFLIPSVGANSEEKVTTAENFWLAVFQYSPDKLNATRVQVTDSEFVLTYETAGQDRNTLRFPRKNKLVIEGVQEFSLIDYPQCGKIEVPAKLELKQNGSHFTAQVSAHHIYYFVNEFCTYRRVKSATPKVVEQLGGDFPELVVVEDEDTNRYMEIASAFNQAPKTELADIRGWKIGRCYGIDRPAQPSGGLFAGFNRADAGSAQLGEMFQMLNPAYFDDILTNPAKKNEAESALVNPAQRFEPAQLIDNTVVIESTPAPGVSFQYRLRKATDGSLLFLAYMRTNGSLQALPSHACRFR